MASTVWRSLDGRTRSDVSRRPKTLVLSLAAAGSAAFVYLRRRAHTSRPAWPVLAGPPLLIAHRGGAGLAPENTLAAFRPAVEQHGADMIELDVHATADGECVVIHDATVDRTTDGTGAVAAMTYAELRELDAGYRFTVAGGATYPFRGRGVYLPTIAEVLTALPETRFTVEVKDGAAQGPLFAAVRRLNAADRVVVASQYERDRTRFAEYHGARSASSEMVRAFYLLHRLRLSGLYRMPADVVQVPEEYQGRRIVSPRFIRALHTQAVQVHVWTVNDQSDMRRLLDWGVDGIVTDRPDLLKRVLEERGRPTP